MAGIQIKVSADVLRKKAKEITGQVSKLQRDWRRMCNVIDHSKTYWEGAASNLHCQYLKDNKEDVNRLLKRMGEHPEDLLAMAGIVSNTEKQAELEGASLPEHVIH